MKKALKLAAALLGLFILGLSWPAWQLYTEIQKGRSEDPLVWEADISALEANTNGLYDPHEGVVFLGSSSIRLWNTLEKDMAPLEVIQHGFGGAKLNDVVYYSQRLVNAYQPRAVVIFAGTNDIHPGASKTPEVLLESYQTLIRNIRAERPDLPIFYIAITPSTMRWSVWPIAQATNTLIEDWSGEDSNLHFIDTTAALMDSNGEPDRQNYRFDGLHLSEKGYRLWRDIIRTRLLAELEDSAGVETVQQEP